MADREVQRSPNMAKSTNNKHGLSPTMPQDVRAEIRRRSKNGCVICRALPYDYHHFDPEFQEAHKHNPAGICLLCTMHHAEATRGRLSKSQVSAAYEKVQNTDDVRPAFYHPEITGLLRLGLGDALFEHMPANACVLEYDGEQILQVGYIQDEVFGGSRPSITGSIFDIKEVELLRIEDNVMTFQAKDVDVRLEGSVLKISGSDGDPVFEMTLDPPDGVRFNRLRMRYKEIVCEMDDTFGLTLPLVNGETARCLVAGIRTKGARAAISYASDRSLWHSNEGKWVGGEGIFVPNSGATLAAGAGVMEIPSFRFETLECLGSNQMSKTTSGRESSVSVSCLLAALKEAQDAVRSYDVKAQIVGVGFIFTIGILTKLGASLPGPTEFNTIGVVLFWLLGIVPILMYGFVLYPSRHSVRSLQTYKEPIHYKFYVSSDRPRDLDAYLKDIGAGDWSGEIAYEIIKVSSLRDLKRARFMRALKFSAFSFGVIAVSQILRSSGFYFFGR